MVTGFSFMVSKNKIKIMKKNKTIPFIIAFSLIVFIELFNGCTKIQHGYLSPFISYTSSAFTVVAGRTTNSDKLNFDGSTTPIHAKWVHFYDSTGKIVDDIFSKKYPVNVWTAAFNPKVDLTFDAITAKLRTDSLPPLVVNEASGVIVSNAGALNLPLGSYTMDLQVTNPQGTEILKKAMTINIVNGIPLGISPDPGNWSNGLFIAGTAVSAGKAGGRNNGAFYNGANNPWIDYTVNRIAESPNMLIVKIEDRNGVPFNPKTGEVSKRPNSGLNPNPPYLQNLQDYAPDTFVATDTAMTLKFPLTPWPITSLGNGFNMYYILRSNAVAIDSVSVWSGNQPGVFYQGTSDPHFLGVYTLDKFDYNFRIPLRIYVPGTYVLTAKILNTTHR